MTLAQSQIFEDEFPLVRSCAALNEIRLAEEIKDLRIELQDGAVLYAHRIILAARIPSLRASLSGQHNEDNSVLRWPTVPLNIATTLVNYVYTGHVEITHANVRGIALLARMMNLPVLESWGEQFLADGVTLDTLSVAWDFARSLNSAPLMEVCVNLMREQFQSFVQSDFFVCMPADTLLSLLQKDYLGVDSEEDVFAAVHRWVCPCEEVDRQRLEMHATTMLKEVRWDQTTVQFRKHLADSYQIFNEDVKCARFMLQIEQWMILPEKDKPPCPFNQQKRKHKTSQKGSSQISIFVFGKDTGSDSWSVLCFDSHLQMGERVADMARREYATYSVVGESIFVVGGWTSQDGWSTSVKEFIVRERRWRDLAPLAIGRRCHASAVVRVGGETTLIGVFGGYNGNSLSSCELYDVSRGSWCNLPDMREKRSDTPAAACLPGDSHIFVFGGYNGTARLASVEFCQLGADWRESATSARTTDFWRPAASMRIARSRLSATPFRGKIIVAGGYGNGGTLSVVELFTPPDTSSPLGQWTALANMQQPRHYFAFLTSANAVFALGNWYENCNTVEEFTPPAGSVYSVNDLKSWIWSFRSPVETLDHIWGAASIRL